MKTFRLFIITIFLSALGASAQDTTYTLLKPDRVFDGQNVHSNWQVLVKGTHIEAVGEASSIKAPASAKTIELRGMTLLPGLIEFKTPFLCAHQVSERAIEHFKRQIYHP